MSGCKVIVWPHKLKLTDTPVNTERERKKDRLMCPVSSVTYLK